MPLTLLAEGETLGAPVGVKITSRLTARFRNLGSRVVAGQPSSAFKMAAEVIWSLKIEI
jgi:hypothetical protein